MLKFELKRACERLSAQGDMETPIKILSVAAGPAQETYEVPRRDEDDHPPDRYYPLRPGRCSARLCLWAVEAPRR